MQQLVHRRPLFKDELVMSEGEIVILKGYTFRVSRIDGNGKINLRATRDTKKTLFT